jgi:SAM-dependent methyltransferase
MTINTGAQLRALYEKEGGVATIFSAKVADYLSSRPDYPDALFQQLKETCNLDRDTVVVADVGAGTGLLTHGLLVRGHTVVAVEPNGSMREAADQLLASFKGYSSVDGSAERIPLDTSSVDLITAAHAFHWFEVEAARRECLRVLRPNGQVALVWNDRVKSDPLHKALDAVLAHCGGAKRNALVAHDERGDIPAFFGKTQPKEFAWPHQHVVDEAGLMSLIFSRSYMPDRDSAQGSEAVSQLREIYRRFSFGNGLTVAYTTVAYLGRPS